MITQEKVELEVLSEVSKIANSTADFKIKLEKIVKVIAGKLGRDVCYIVLVDKESGNLVLKAAEGLNPDSVDRVMLKMGEGVTGWVAEHMEPVALEQASEDPRFKAVPQTGEDRYKSMASVPIIFDERCIGVMTVQTVEPYVYTADEVTLLSTIANDVGGIINSAQLYQEAKQNLEALSALYEVSRDLISTLDLDTLLERVARSSADIIGAKGCILRLIDKATGMLEIKASYGLAHELGRKNSLSMGESIAGRVAAEGKPMLISDISEYPDLMGVTVARAKSFLCVPLIAKDEVIGTIALYDKEETREPGEPRFTEEDLHLLSTLASQASMAVENAFIYEKAGDLAVENEQKARELAFLYDVANAMRTTLKLDKLLHIILTAVTMGGGMGFNRAMLFLVNEKMNTLQGMLGVGPSSAEEASRIWAQIGGATVDFKDWTISDEQVAAQKEEPFNRMVKSMRVSYEDEQGVFATAVREKRALNVVNAKDDPMAGPRVMDLVGSGSFAAVPLIAKDRVVSLIVVDNKFTGKQITESDLRFLMMFANQAGLAIESAMAYSNLEQANRILKETQDKLIQSEKMAALGEMAATIAHEIKNPLTVIGGFAARLEKKSSPAADSGAAAVSAAAAGNARTAEGAARYARIIRDEARRLEKILDNVLDFSREKRPSLELCSLNDVCASTLAMYKDGFEEKGIKLIEDYEQTLGSMVLDPQQIEQALINILTNSEQAMAGGGKLVVRTILDRDGGQAVVEISDTGGGIPRDVLGDIFNPFYTTKDKGTGLGLAITDKIVKSHGGEIEVINDEGKGVTFRIRLPYLG